MSDSAYLIFGVTVNSSPLTHYFPASDWLPLSLLISFLITLFFSAFNADILFLLALVLFYFTPWFFALILLFVHFFHLIVYRAALFPNFLVLAFYIVYLFLERGLKSSFVSALVLYLFLQIPSLSIELFLFRTKAFV